MEAASARLRTLPATIRIHGFERECERLRPLGIAYVLRRFGGQLGHADAEDAVAEVIVRLHRRLAQGQPPRNLRAAFFTSVRNAAIDQLRSRTARPTVALEAVSEAPALEASPLERAEGDEEAVRLREALGRMRGNYREAILLRFGLGLSVPEIAAKLQISLPAAKKLVLRAAAQVRKRLAAIEGEEFCPEMRDLARRSLFEKEASELAAAPESELLRAHFAHCGSCRSFLARLHEELHELGGLALLAGGGFRVHARALEALAGWLGQLGGAAQRGASRARLLAWRSGAAVQPEGAAGALGASGQKIAAICTAGAATAATCLASGVVGPGVSLSGSPSPPPQRPAAARVSSPPPAARSTVVPPAASAAPAASPPSGSAPSRAAATKRTPAKRARRSSASSTQTPAQQAQSQFGFEGGGTGGAQASSPSASASVSSTAEPAPEPTPEAAPEPAPEPAPSQSGGGSGTESFGFQG